MKTLTKPNITVTGDKITICATIEDLPFSGLLVTRVSHGHTHPDSRHIRRIQSSNEAVFVESRAGKFAIPNTTIAAIAAYAMPESSFCPVFKRHSTPSKVLIASETPVSFQWQLSDNPTPESDKSDTPPPPAVWTNIEGQTNDSLDESTVPVGKWTRCIATNLAGSTISQPAQKK